VPIPVAYKDNNSNLIEHSDYGIKIAKTQYNVENCADIDLVFNSSWSSIPIVKVKNVVSGDVVPHGLSYPTVAFMLGGSAYRTVMYGVDVDSVNLYPSDTGVMVVYDVDITVDREYPYTQTVAPSVDVFSNDYGIKVAKHADNIDSEDMRDFILHSRCGSPMVLAVKTEETVNDANKNIVQYTSQMGYPTLNFGYSGRIQGSLTTSGRAYGNLGYQFAPQGGGAIPIAFTDGYTVYTEIHAAFSDSRASVVCLRNPMFSTTNSVEVSY